MPTGDETMETRTGSKVQELVEAVKDAVIRRGSWWYVGWRSKRLEEHRKDRLSRDHAECPYCGGPMVDLPDDEAGEDYGPLTQWKRCGSCGLHQEGELRRAA